jgi:cysteinyl-tRNA synthetase
MSTEILGENFDIHGGGLDLIFPHHENEIAQAEAATGKCFANYWVHNGLLSVNGEKMSKSLGNYITISDFLDKYKDPELLKIFFLMSHYHSPVDYSDEKIEEAKRSKERIMIFIDKADRLLQATSGELEKGPVQAEAAEKAERKADDLRRRFESAMNDDINTPSALSVIFEAVHIGNDCLSDESIALYEKVHVAGALKNFILKSAKVFNLFLRSAEVGAKEASEIEKLIAQREEAREKKDYAMADKIRGKLMEKGVLVEDTPEGPIWRKS